MPRTLELVARVQAGSVSPEFSLLSVADAAYLLDELELARAFIDALLGTCPVNADHRHRAWHDEGAEDLCRCGAVVTADAWERR
jgi:hypothetical protein